jgi:large subunit ribosomal protein L20
MARIKRGTVRTRKRKSFLKLTKGYRWGRKNKIKLAKTAINKAGQHAYRGRKERKRDFRRLWQVQINAAARQSGLSYSKFIDKLKKAKSELDRKVLADLAKNEPAVFAKLIEKIKSVK